ARRALVERLKERRVPPPAVDSAAPLIEAERPAAAMEPALPGEMPDGVVALGPLALEHRLGLAVATLLPPIRAHRVPAVVPHDGGGREPDSPAVLLHAPAEIHVVAGDAVDRIESAHSQQHGAAEGHVAAGDVLGNAIREQ